MPARKKSVTQAHRSTQWFKENGYLVENVEQTIRYPDKITHQMKVFKRDLFGAFDLIAVRADGEQHGVTLCQATVGMGTNKTSRMEKVKNSPATIPLLRAGNEIELHVWRKLGKSGCRKLWSLARYQARIFGTGISWIELEDEESVEDSFSFGTAV